MKRFKVQVNGQEYLVSVSEVDTDTNVPEAPPEEVKPAIAQTISGIPVKAPLRGTVLSVNATQGQTVQAGSIVLTLEALKLENEITAPQDGKITAIQVKEGDSVEAGDVLFVLE